MYKLVTIQDVVRIPPQMFSEDLEKSVAKVLRETYEGKIDPDTGVIISTINPRDVSDGKIIPGDSATYHTVVFDALVYKPEVQEVVRGIVVDIAEFGAFVRSGPFDGLVHASQVTDDFMSVNEKTGVLTGKQTKRTLKKDDIVYARITSISYKDNVTETKINMTMRQPGLGKTEWWKKKKTSKKKG